MHIAGQKHPGFPDAKSSLYPTFVCMVRPAAAHESLSPQKMPPHSRGFEIFMTSGFSHQLKLFVQLHRRGKFLQIKVAAECSVDALNKVLLDWFMTSNIQFTCHWFSTAHVMQIWSSVPLICQLGAPCTRVKFSGA